MHSLSLLMAPVSKICPNQKLSFFFSPHLGIKLMITSDVLYLWFFSFDIPGSNSHPPCLRLYYTFLQVYFSSSTIFTTSVTSPQRIFWKQMLFHAIINEPHFHKSNYISLTLILWPNTFVSSIPMIILTLPPYVMICDFPNIACSSWESIYFMVKSVGSLGRAIWFKFCFAAY